VWYTPINCDGCHACCLDNHGRFPPYSDLEIKKLPQWVKLKIGDGAEGRCSLLTDDGNCSVHGICKPRDCTDFPVGGPECIAARKMFNEANSGPVVQNFDPPDE
jgi:Fe-S-cluster containining protein